MEKQGFDILGDIRRRFYGRAKRDGKSFSPELVRLVVLAARNGKRQSEIAAAAGVSKQSISTWVRKGKNNAPAVELQLVTSPAAPIEKVPPVTARVHLRGNAVLEFPLSALDERLFGILGGAQ